MPRFKHEVTGVVVDVSDDVADGLGSGYLALDKPKASEPKKKPAPKRAASDDDE